MEKNVKDTAEKIGKMIGNDRKLYLILTVGVLLMIILFFSEFLPSGDKSEKKFSLNADISVEQTQKIISEQIRDIVETVDGAGRTEVFVSIKQAEEYCYAADTDEKSSDSSFSLDSQYICLEDSDGNPSGLLITVKSPEIDGVAITCDGGDSALVKNEIVNLVTSVWNIGSNRVYVGKYKRSADK